MMVTPKMHKVSLYVKMPPISDGGMMKTTPVTDEQAVLIY